VTVYYSTILCVSLKKEDCKRNMCIISSVTQVFKLDTCRPDTLYLREKGCEDSRLFFEAKRGPRAKRFGKRWFGGKMPGGTASIWHDIVTIIQVAPCCHEKVHTSSGSPRGSKHLAADA